MEHTSTSSARGVHDRRRDVRARTIAARASTATGEHYRTPVWLERSFVLPVQGEVSMPSQPTPDHDDLEFLPLSARIADRPAAPAVDFAAVVRRSDATRRARRVAAFVLTLGVLAGVGAVVVGAGLVVPVAVSLVVAGLAAGLWCLDQERAPIPLRD
jgi:hypothetical protein